MKRLWHWILKHLTKRWAFVTYAGHLDYQGKRDASIHRREKFILGRRVKCAGVEHYKV